MKGWLGNNHELFAYLDHSGRDGERHETAVCKSASIGPRGPLVLVGHGADDRRGRGRVSV